MKIGIKPLIVLFIITLTVTILINVNSCFAFDFNTQSGLDVAGKETGHTSIGITSQIKDNPGKVVGVFVQALLSFLGVIFLLLMIYGGFIWMMAQGNEQEVGRAKNIIINAAIGIIIVFLAYAITTLIGGQLVDSVAP